MAQMSSAVWDTSVCEAPVAADDAGLLSVEGQGDGTDVIGG